MLLIKLGVKDLRCSKQKKWKGHESCIIFLPAYLLGRAPKVETEQSYQLCPNWFNTFVLARGAETAGRIASLMKMRYLYDGVEKCQQPGVHFIHCFGSAQSPFTVSLPLALDLGDPEQLIHFVDSCADGATSPTVEGNLLEPAATNEADDRLSFTEYKLSLLSIPQSRIISSVELD